MPQKGTEKRRSSEKVISTDKAALLWMYCKEIAPFETPTFSENAGEVIARATRGPQQLETQEQLISRSAHTGAQAEDSPAMGEFPTSTATDTELIALGEQLEGLLREYMDAWLEWAPRMRAAHAEAKDNTSALAVAVQRTGCDVAQQRMSELEHDMQPLAERIIAAPVTSLGGLRAKALVALWEALPATASHQGAFDFPDASRSLFEAVAGMTGLLPLVSELEARLEADGGI
jgi:hypothetical protein